MKTDGRLTSGWIEVRLNKAIFIVLLFSPVSAGADIANFTGFETGSNLEATQTGGTFSIQTSVVRTGTYALQTNPTGNGTGFFDLRAFNANGISTSLNASTVTARFYFRYATKPAAWDEMIARTEGTALKFELRLNSAGNLVAYDSVPVSLSTGSTVLSADTWYRIDIKSGFGSAGDWEVRINGVSEMAGTGNLGVEVNRLVSIGKQLSRSGNSVDYFFDDFSISNTPTYPPDGQCKMMLPNANGAAQTFTIGAGTDHYTAVNEIPPDGNTSYLVSDLTVGNAETEALQDSGTVGISGTVNVVKVVNSAARDGATNGTFRTRLRSGATNSDSGGANTGAGYNAYSRLLETDPATTAAWTVSALDSVESGGVEGETTDESRLTFTSLMVDYTPAAAADATNPAALLYKSLFHKAFFP